MGGSPALQHHWIDGLGERLSLHRLLRLLPLSGRADMMDRIQDQIFRNSTVRMDGKLFVHCTFEGCALCYGGERCEWEGTTFTNCRLTLDGAANNTIQLLQALGFSITASNLDAPKLE
jgi:hypothetical protein